MKLILASDNAHKLLEFRKLFEGSDVELMTKKEAEAFLRELGSTRAMYDIDAVISPLAVVKQRE